MLNIYRSTQMGSVISVQIREWMNGRLRGRRQSFDVLSIRGRWSLLWLEENWSTLRWTRYVGGHTFILHCHLNIHLRLNVCLSIKTSLSFQSGQLNEYTERKEMSADVVCMSLASVPPGEQRSRFLAVGLVDNTVRIISLDPSVSYNLLLFSWPADLDIQTRILVTAHWTCVKCVISLLHRTVFSRWVCRLFPPSQSLFVLWRWVEWKNRMSWEKRALLAFYTSTLACRLETLVLSLGW